jgi:hypothetical protein
MITSADDTQRYKATNSCCMYISLVPPPPPEINHAHLFLLHPAPAAAALAHAAPAALSRPNLEKNK